ncbi:hypothetical protein [Microvirga solisilvae]|uniref:hypothetical protein n=1 Tax=Microvirga solisilvae TaxID=2919498 RepID=UPI001FAE9CA8|nr:hypothetical protein [Microvirga solisilvae]
MMHCPTRDEIVQQALPLLPRGRAWQTHEGGPQPGSVLYRFWLAVAEHFEFVNRRICDIYAEFFCRTASETLDLWMAEYGLPDPCDPYADLCARVAAYEGARCEDYVAAAARNGWVIECASDPPCGSYAGAAYAGEAVAGGASVGGVLQIRVFVDRSPAFTGGVQTPPLAGLLQAGLPLACEPDISSLVCLLERIVHAHLIIQYEIVA